MSIFITRENYLNPHSPKPDFSRRARQRAGGVLASKVLEEEVCRLGAQVAFVNAAERMPRAGDVSDVSSAMYHSQTNQKPTRDIQDY